MKESELDPLIEIAVWGHLDSKTNLELILLKGHLLIEKIVDTTLGRSGIQECKNLSFYRKILILENINIKESQSKGLIISSLKTLNKLRNKFAHEFHFDINNGEFEKWSSEIIENMEGNKFTKFTYRTKIVHAFSILARNILEMKETKTVECEKGT